MTNKDEEARRQALFDKVLSENGIGPKLESTFAEMIMENSEVLDPGNKSNIGRNDPCHCGSQEKYKKCCGK